MPRVVAVEELLVGVGGSEGDLVVEVVELRPGVFMGSLLVRGGVVGRPGTGVVAVPGRGERAAALTGASSARPAPPESPHGGYDEVWR